MAGRRNYHLAKKTDKCPRCGSRKTLTKPDFGCLEIGLTGCSMLTLLVPVRIMVNHTAKCHKCGHTWKISSLLSGYKNKN